jgi:polysaccharide deacetylase 2 family uncharacterized protein YibQ
MSDFDEVVNKVREQLGDKSTMLTSEERHQIAYAKRVTAAVGYNPTDITDVLEIMSLLKRLDVSTFKDEYPKMLDDGTIANSAEEATAKSAPVPEAEPKTEEETIKS